MPMLVTAGATLGCSMGSTPSALQAQGTAQVVSAGHPTASIADNKAYQNIPAFGQCASPTNPGVSAGLRSRHLQRPACAPIIVSPWIPGSSSVTAGGLRVLTAGSQCHCQYGGTISVLAPGQSTITAS